MSANSKANSDEYTQALRYTIITSFIASAFNTTTFLDAKYKPLVDRMLNVKEFKDTDELCKYMKIAITLSVEFHFTDDEIISYLRDNTIINKLFESIQDTDFLDKFLDKLSNMAKKKGLIKDAVTGKFKEPVLH